MNEKELYKSIGKRIASVRKEHGITQETLANKLGVTTKHISHVENGTSSLSLKAFIQFCEEFSCSLDYLVFGRDFSSDFLPDSIIKIMNSGTETDRNRLLRYLEFFNELSSIHKK